MMFCGVDEAGRGPVMGPLVVGAVYVEDDDVLRSIGVKDSKKLTPRRREAMYDEIISAVEGYSIITLSAEEIDAKRERTSLNMVEMEMFAEAVSRMPVTRVYVDCPDPNEEKFGNMLSVRINNTPVTARHKADDTYPVVSAASILAKVTRDRLIAEISEEFGENIGSGYPSDPVTIAFIEKWLKEKGCTPRHTRNSWDTVRNLKSRLLVRKITDW
ncbi:MAG: ribonuclease HII [Candidatus Methanomethylophilaceae archaeon]|nr:ribonuclease HII [Candidatus Methanomethylophilaceae archaeon]